MNPSLIAAMACTHHPPAPLWPPAPAAHDHSNLAASRHAMEHAPAIPMLTVTKPAANQRTTMSWSSPLPPEAPQLDPSLQAPPLPAIAGALPADTAVEHLACVPCTAATPARPARRPSRPRPPPARATPPLHPPDTAPVPPSPRTSPTTPHAPVPPAACRDHPVPLHCPELSPAYKTPPLGLYPAPHHHSTTPSPSPRSRPGAAPELELGAPATEPRRRRARRRPGHLRRRHRRPAAAPDLRRRPPPSPPSLAAGR